MRAKSLATIVFANSTNASLDEPRPESWEQGEEIVGRYLEAWTAKAAARESLAGR